MYEKLTSTVRSQDERYEVALPWKEVHEPQLPVESPITPGSIVPTAAEYSLLTTSPCCEE